MEQLPYKITSHAELKARIAYLESIKDQQEEVLKQNIHEVYKSLQPAELLKSAIANIRKDEEIGKDAASIAGKAGIDLVVGKIFGKNNSLGGMVKSLVVSEILHVVYNRYQDKIHDFIGNMTGKVLEFFNFDARPTPPKAEEEKEEEE